MSAHIPAPAARGHWLLRVAGALQMVVSAVALAVATSWTVSLTSPMQEGTNGLIVMVLGAGGLLVWGFVLVHGLLSVVALLLGLGRRRWVLLPVALAWLAAMVFLVAGWTVLSGLSGWQAGAPAGTVATMVGAVALFSLPLPVCIVAAALPPRQPAGT